MIEAEGSPTGTTSLACPIRSDVPNPDNLPKSQIPNAPLTDNLPRYRFGPSLSDHRQRSTIPSRYGPWIYPSENQFYKTTVAKGADVLPQDMKIVVAVHNAINEKAWENIMEYEKPHLHICPEPKLIRFSGISEVKTPKARWREFIGYVPPFDTHEWLVDRCGKTVRYLIDYYEGPSRPLSGAPIAVHIDVRPEFSFSVLIDQAKDFWRYFRT